SAAACGSSSSSYSPLGIVHARSRRAQAGPPMCPSRTSTSSSVVERNRSRPALRRDDVTCQVSRDGITGTSGTPWDGWAPRGVRTRGHVVVGDPAAVGQLVPYRRGADLFATGLAFHVGEAAAR